MLKLVLWATELVAIHRRVVSHEEIIKFHFSFIVLILPRKLNPVDFCSSRLSHCESSGRKVVLIPVLLFFCIKGGFIAGSERRGRM